MEFRYRKDNTLDVWELLDSHITKNILPRSGHVHFYPSEASVEVEDKVTGHTEVVGKCIRASYFRFTNQLVTKGEEPDAETWSETDHSATQEWKFEISKQTEKMITERFKRAGVFVGNNVGFLIRDANIKGELDNVIIDPWTNELVIVEQKSIYGYYGEKQVFGTPTDRKLGRKGTPKAEHELQLALYVWHWRETISYGKLLYFSRGSADREQFTLKVEEFDNDGVTDFHIVIDGKIRPYTINSILNRQKRLGGYIDRKEIPPREFDAQYSDDYIKCLSLSGKLGKTDQKKYDVSFKKGRTPLVKKGDWRCSYCSFFENCYDKQKHPINDNILGEFITTYREEEEIKHTCSTDMYKWLADQCEGSSMDPEEDIEVNQDNELLYKGTLQGFLDKPKLYRPARQVTQSSFKLWETTPPSTT